MTMSERLNTPISELPRLLEQYEARNFKHATTFNRVRAACQAFARDNAGGKSEAVWKAVTSVRRRKERSLRMRERYPMMPDELLRVASSTDDETARIILSMALTGMGVGEYWGEWSDDPASYAIRVFGAKVKTRDRSVFRIIAPAVPEILLGEFRRRFRVASRKAELFVRPYDLRRTFAKIMEVAGVIPTNAAAYMGHGPRTMTELYAASGHMERFLINDAATVRRAIKPLQPLIQRLGLAVEVPSRRKSRHA